MSPVSTRICVPNLVAVRRSCRKKGGGYRQTDRQAKKTAALYSRYKCDRITKIQKRAIRLTRALLRLERTMNCWREGREGKGGWGREGGEGTEGGWGERVGRGREGEREGGERGRVGERGRAGREEGWGGRVGREVGEGRGGEGRGGEGRGGMTVIHIVIGMFTSNPMIPQYLNNNLT